jgi:S-DNA-T family DNA segregation ATPase FtsK/SpoIIIE
MDKVSRVKEEIAGVLIILTGILVLVSLVTSHPWDSSFSTESTELNNLLGPFGSYLADILHQVFGYSSYILPVVLVMYGIRKVIGKSPGHRAAIIAASIAILILSSSTLLALAMGSPSEHNPSGGVVGHFVSGISLKILSTTGSYMIFIPLTVVTLMYLVPFSIVDLIRALREKTSVGARAVSSVREQRRRPPLIAEPDVSDAVETQESLPLKPVGKVPEARTRTPEKTGDEYRLPEIKLLEDSPPVRYRPSKEDLLSTSGFLEKKLKDFSIDGKVTHVSPGPIVTMFEFEPAPGIKINRIISLSDDLAMAFKSSSMRISPIHGRSTLGIEIPNQEREDVFLKDIFISDAFKEHSSRLIVALGKDIFGVPVTADLSRMPHLLVAGATGAGKSVTINAMILSILYRATPRDVKMLMIDPKMLELSSYEGIPHLLLPVITSPKEASGALRKIVFEMERRYSLLAETGSRNIDAYNKKIAALREHQKTGVTESGEGDAIEPLPYIVIIIDELADLMLVSAREVEDSIARLAQMARAAGIHLILATQRPSVDVITGVIKANFPSRIAFHVSSKIDSRIIIDTYGAEKLLGRGDMLFMTPGRKTIRVHGAFVSEEEIRAVVDFIRSQGGPDYTDFESLAPAPDEEAASEDRDELYHRAKDLVISAGQASISYIQRRMKIGYNRAARIMEMLEEDGIVGPPGEAGKPREVLRGRK